ncbi:hypothetical protein C0995_000523 [Termitomyces sp. Mi166|nr:hypothetical protein C0995_000523 [Termitomyces sp. Mi166\
MPSQCHSPIVEDMLLKEASSKGVILKDSALTEEPELILFTPELSSSTAVLSYDSDSFMTLTNPFSDVAAPVKVYSTPSLALYPFVRRMSIPRHRPSFCAPTPASQAVTVLRKHATVFRHGSLADDAVSYFPPSQYPLEEGD